VRRARALSSQGIDLRAGERTAPLVCDHHGADRTAGQLRSTITSVTMGVPVGRGGSVLDVPGGPTGCATQGRSTAELPLPARCGSRKAQEGGPA
jgi:hypothetical protein